MRLVVSHYMSHGFVYIELLRSKHVHCARECVESMKKEKEGKPLNLFDLSDEDVRTCAIQSANNETIARIIVELFLSNYELNDFINTRPANRRTFGECKIQFDIFRTIGFAIELSFDDVDGDDGGKKDFSFCLSSSLLHSRSVNRF